MNASVEFPDDTIRYLSERGSVSVEQVRKIGLTVTVKGETGTRLVVLAFAFKEGRIGKPWTSRPLPEVSGSRLLPGDTFLDEAALKSFLKEVKMPRDWTGLLLVVSASDKKAARGVKTKPLFALVQPGFE